MCAAALARALPSVIVDTEKVLREADGSVKLVAVRPHTDGKVFAPGCASKPDGESREEPEEHKREFLDGLARITLEELAITHSVKDGTLQNACSTRPRVVVGLGKSAHSHIVRLMNSRQKGPKKMMTKVQLLY